MTMPMSFFNQTKFGRIISRMTSDIDSVRAGVQDVAFVLVVQGLQMAVSAALMAWYDWKLFSLMVLLAPIIWVVNENYRHEMSRRLRKVQESWSRVASTLAESVERHPRDAGVCAAGSQRRLFPQTDQRAWREQRGRGAGLGGVRAAAAIEEPACSSARWRCWARYGALRWHGWLHMEVGDLVMFFFLANLFFDPVQVIGNQLNQALMAMAGAERLFRMLDQKPEWQDAAGRQTAAGHRRAAWNFRRCISNTSRAGRCSTDISFVAEPGQTVALVGHTGSGKTTLVGLLQKFYLPAGGRVLVDGVDLNTVTSDSLRSQMGSVQQNNFLFSGTVLDNIRFARPEATEADVRATLAALDCLDLLDALPQGLHTQVAERGASLSFGQRQLVCFARAMLANPRIVVLDEATSAIDTVTEARLQRALEILLRGRTAFVVAHRLSTIRKADLVLVLDQGRIVERGTHESLLRQDGVYARLHREFVSAQPTGTR